MDLSNHRIILQESLIGRAIVEGPYRLSRLIAVSSAKYGLTLGIPFMCFAGLWHWRINGLLAVERMWMGFILGMFAGMFARVAIVLIGRELVVFDGGVLLKDSPRHGESWRLDELASVRIIDGPREWTTLEFEIRRARKCWTVRFVANCREEDRSVLRNVFRLADE